MSQFKKITPPLCPWHGLPLQYVAPGLWQCPAPPQDHTEPTSAQANEFQDQPGALWSLYREQETRKITAHLSDPTPTGELPHVDEDTLRLASVRVTARHRVKSGLFGLLDHLVISAIMAVLKLRRSSRKRLVLSIAYDLLMALAVILWGILLVGIVFFAVVVISRMIGR